MTILGRLCAALVVVMLVSIVTPGTSWAGHRHREPLITMTDIVAPEGQAVNLHSSMEIESDGSVLLNLDGDSAVWRRGRFESIDVPIGDGVPLVGVTDLSRYGQIAVGSTNLPPCGDPSNPLRICPRPFLWDDGETTLLPTDGLTGRALHVSKRGSIVVGVLQRYLPEEERLVEEVVGWVDGELVEGPEGTDDEDDIVAVNNRGQALLQLEVDGETHLAIWQVGRGVTDLGTFGDTSLYGPFGLGINDRGDVVGWRSDPEAGTQGGFLWRKGKTIDLGLMEPVDINDRGQILGECSDGDLTTYACLWDDGEVTELGRDIGLTPIAINDRGQVIGQANVGGTDIEYHSFLWQKGRLTDLRAASGFDGNLQAVDINDRGQIVGVLGNVSEGRRYVVWTVWR